MRLKIFILFGFMQYTIKSVFTMDGTQVTHFEMIEGKLHKNQMNYIPM